jgi:anaerobic selenocysteine-containing dehydrogenase
MLTRRQILLASATATSCLALGATGASALSSEPMAADDARALALACRATASHEEMVKAMRRQLEAEVTQGLRPAAYHETVACPFCSCGLNVTPDIAF